MTTDNQTESSNAADLLFKNAHDFLNTGLRLVFKDSATTGEAKLGIVSIQTAIELLLKYRLVKEAGFKPIVRGRMPKTDLANAASSRKLETIGFAESLQKIHEYEYLSDMDQELLEHVRNLSFALVNFTANVDLEEVKHQLAWALVGVLAKFAAGHDRDQGEMQNHRRFLESDVFNYLVNFEPYRHQSVDAAIEDPDSDDLYRCWVCGADALAERPSETYFCYCCGLTAVTEMAAFVNCSLCGKENGVCYDPLNATDGIHFGKCLHCETSVGALECQECETTYSQAQGLAERICPRCLDQDVRT